MSDPIPVAMPTVHHIMDADEIEKITGFRLGVGRVPPPKQIVEYVIHEEHMRLDNALISVVGKSMEQIAKERKDLEAKGYRFVGQDSFNVIMQSIPRKPIGFMHEFHGEDKALRQYREGLRIENMDTGEVTQVIPPHYRTWGSPGFIDLAGQIHKEKLTREEFQKHWEQTGRFSKLVWVDDWEKFKEIM